MFWIRAMKTRRKLKPGTEVFVLFFIWSRFWPSLLRVTVCTSAEFQMSCYIHRYVSINSATNKTKNQFHLRGTESERKMKTNFRRTKKKLVEVDSTFIKQRLKLCKLYWVSKERWNLFILLQTFFRQIWKRKRVTRW